jgi:plastocyanin
MTPTRLNAVILLACLPLLGNCSKEPKSEPAKASEAAPATVPTAEPNKSSPGEGVGTITGKVVFTGTYAAGKTMISKDREVCGDAKLDPSMVIGKQGELKNAVIQIGDLKHGKSTAKEVELDQVKCEYVPHVAVVSTGATVKIKNSDGILHNVHSVSEKNMPFNRAQPKFMKEIKETFSKPEIVQLRCDVHGWMSGWIVVTENVFFDVTEADGTFRFDSVPVGKYTLEVWHEILGKTTQQVDVKVGEVTNVTFEFQLKK